MVTEHRDIISIEVRAERAKGVLAELRANFDALQREAMEAGTTIDAALGMTGTPMQQLIQAARLTVMELEHIRQALVGIGAVAGAPRAAAAGIQQMGTAARSTQAQLRALNAMQMGGPWSAATARGYQAFGAMQPYQPEWTTATLEAQQRLATQAPAAPAGAAPAAQVADIDAMTEAYRRQIEVAQRAGDPKAVRQATKDYDTFVRAQGRVTKGFEDTGRAAGRFSGTFRRHIVWFAQGTIIYMAISSALRAVSDTIEGAVESLMAYDTAMGRMRFITGEGTAELYSLADAARGAGVAFGQMPTDVLPGLVQITQATKDYSEQLQFAQDAAKWAFLSGQEYSEGLEQLVSVERVWNLEAAEGQRVLDAVATSYRVAMIPMDEMMSTLERGGKIAESVGLSFEEYSATIAAVGEFSNLTASQVTTLMEAVSARPFQPALAQRFQKEFGFLDIPLFEPGTAGTERRAVADIIDDLVNQWDRLTAAQRQSAAEVMVGRRLASEFLTLMEAWQHVPDYVDEYNDNLGEANRLLGEQLNTLQGQKDIMRAAWADVRTELGLYISDLLGLKEIYRDIAVTMAAYARRQRIARGEPAEGYTPEQAIQAEIDFRQRQLEALERAPRGARIGGGFRREEQIEQLEAEIYFLESQLRDIQPPSPYGAPGDVMGEYRAALQETAQAQREFFSEEAIMTQQMAEMMEGVIDFEPWIQGFDAVTSAIDLSEYSLQQINMAQNLSIQQVGELVSLYLQMAEALKGSELTLREENAIMENIYNWANEQVVVYRDIRGQLQIIQGQAAAFLQDNLRALEAQQEAARFDIRRLGQVQPEQFGQLQQGAWQWQAYLQTLPGYDEEARQFYVVLADNVARPITTTATALRYAIEDLTEVEKRQLEGMWNLPAGATAYVPITSLFYQRQGAEGGGPPGAVPMAGPPTGISESAMRGIVPSAPDVGTAVADASYVRFGPPLDIIIAKLEGLAFLPGETRTPEGRAPGLTQEAVRAMVAERGRPQPWQPEREEPITPTIDRWEISTAFQAEDMLGPDPLGLSGIKPSIDGLTDALLRMEPVQPEAEVRPEVELGPDPLGLANMIPAIENLAAVISQQELAQPEAFRGVGGEAGAALREEPVRTSLFDIGNLAGVLGSAALGMTTTAAALQSIATRPIEVSIPPIRADIRLQSSLTLDKSIIARTVHEELGKELSSQARAYGMRGGGNGPHVMM